MITWTGLINGAVLWVVMNAVAWVASFEAAVIAGLALLGLFIGDVEQRTLALQEEEVARL